MRVDPIVAAGKAMMRKANPNWMIKKSNNKQASHTIFGDLLPEGAKEYFKKKRS